MKVDVYILHYNFLNDLLNKLSHAMYLTSCKDIYILAIK